MRQMKELFVDNDLQEYLTHNMQRVKIHIKSLRLLSQNDYYNLSASIIKEYEIEPLMLRENEIRLVSQADDYHTDTKIIVVRFVIPFVGYHHLFTCRPGDRPKNIIEPFGIISEKELEFAIGLRYSSIGESNKRKLHEAIDIFNEFIRNINYEVTQYNKWLHNEVPLLAKSRYNYIKKVQETLDSFGI